MQLTRNQSVTAFGTGRDVEFRTVSDRAALWPLARAVARQTPIADLLPLLHEHALRVANGRVSVLLRLDPRAGRLHATSAAPASIAGSGPWMSDAAGHRAVERALADGSPLVVDDIPLLIERLGTQVAILIPIRSGLEPLGLLVVGTDRRDYAAAVCDELSVIGDLAAVALECRRLQRERTLQRELRTLVSELTRAVSSSLHLNASLRLFCERAARLLDATAVTVWLHDRRAHELELVASSTDAPTGQRMPTDAPPAAAMRGTRAVRATPERNGQSDIILPLRGSRRALGILTVTGLAADPTDEIDVLDRLEEAAFQVSTAIENVLLLEDVLRSRRELESTFNSMADLVVVVDGSLAVAHANRAFALRAGQRPADLVGRPIETFFGSELVTWLQQFPAERELPASAAREIRDPVLDGTFLVTLSPLKGRENERIGTVLVARDVTQQAQLEAEHTELRDRLAQTEKLAALGQFVAGIAHELNNPLQGVLGHIELLLQEPVTVPPGFKRDLRLVLREADRAAKIVHDLLVFAGSRRITRRRLNVNHVVTRVLALRASSAAAAGIEITTDLAAKPPRVAGDALLLQQALINIVVNAEQALAGGPGAKRIDVRTRAVGRRAVEIRIADTGPGLAPDVLPRLFEPFFTTKDVGQGTGLGLAIAYGIVQEHDGRLSGTNDPAGGAIFTIELPAG